jgi:hypothetical protein
MKLYKFIQTRFAQFTFLFLTNIIIVSYVGILQYLQLSNIEGINLTNFCKWSNIEQNCMLLVNYFKGIVSRDGVSTEAFGV